MTPQHTLVLVHGRRSVIAWGRVCAMNAAVCLSVIGVMLTFAQPSGCRIRSSKMAIKTVEQALVAYQTDNTDLCPKSLDDLVAQHCERLVFMCPGVQNKDGADIVSKGRDRILGTSDDVKSWEL